MPIEILMPALSPTMEEGTLSKWTVKEGDTVNSGDVIANVTMTGGAGGGLGSVLNATAIGNAQSAYVCASCPVGVTGEINQL